MNTKRALRLVTIGVLLVLYILFAYEFCNYFLNNYIFIRSLIKRISILILILLTTSNLYIKYYSRKYARVIYYRRKASR